MESDIDEHYTLVLKDDDTTTYVVTVGDKYWSNIRQGGTLNVVSAPQVEHIEFFEETIVVKVNRVRTYTTHYVAEFFDRNENPKKRLISRFSFVSRETLNTFLTLVSERTGGRFRWRIWGKKDIRFRKGAGENEEDKEMDHGFCDHSGCSFPDCVPGGHPRV